MPDHHLPDEFLLEYASGSSDPGHALMVACHATLCPVCRGKIEAFEDLGGMLLAQSAMSSPLDPAKLDDAAASVLDGVMAQVRAEPRGSSGRAAEVPSRPSGAADGVLPLPLIEVVGSLDAISWRRPIPGVEVHEFDLPGANTVMRMTRVKPGAFVGQHDHEGRELDLVLAGGLRDVTRGGEFERGDIQYAEPGVNHDLQTLPGEPCLVFTVNEGAVKPRGTRAQLIYRWLGWNR